MKNAGSARYIHSDTNVALHQDKTSVPGTAEEADGFGSSLAGDANQFAVGSPGEAIGTDEGAGGVAVFNPNKLDADNMPTPMFGLDQDLDTFSGGPRPATPSVRPSP
ncbi:hypothetical protein [Streptomyces aureus]|uniref:hypothetical protein n=1 Tax=Streptomyces aureus TaxID=193461 RepID=UPI0033D13E9A